MPRPGFVLDVDRSTPPTLFWHGEGFRLEKLPADRSRVIYAPEPHDAIDDIDGAIRNALLNPIDMDPLPTLLFPGMKLTIAFDDVSLPLPKMQRPDLRQRIIEQVLTMAADAGVDDVHIIAALALHRRMHEFELRHALGDRVYDAFEPRGCCTSTTPRIPTSSPSSARRPRARRSRSTSGPPSPTCWSTSTSTSSPWTAGGSRRPSASRRTARSATITTRTTMEASHSFMDQHRSELHKSSWRMGKVMRDHGPKIFQIETTLNTDPFPKPFGYLSQARVGVERQGPGDVPRRPRSRWPRRRRGSPARSSTASRRRTR